MEGRAGAAWQDEITVCLEATGWFADAARWAGGDSQAHRLYTRTFARIADAAADQWGKPAFRMVGLTPWEYPDEVLSCLEEELYWRGSIALAYWAFADRLVCLSVEHEDQETPVLLIAGAHRPYKKNAFRGAGGRS